MGFFAEKKGLRCEQIDATTFNCTPYVEENGQKKGTGSNFTITANPEQNCEPQFSGNFDLSDEDMKKANQAGAIAQKACRRGLG